MRTTRDFDYLVLISAAVLCVVGLCLIYSVFRPQGTGYTEHVDFAYFNRQLLWLCFGLLSMLAGFTLPCRYFEALAHVFYAICIVLLIVVLFVDSGGPTQRWLVIGPMRLQPSEFTKIGLLLVWARILSGHMGPFEQTKKTALALLFLVVPFVLVLEQPDLGTAIVLFVMLLPVLYWRGLAGRQVLFILSPILAVLLIIYSENIAGNPWPFGIFIVGVFVVAWMNRSRLRESLLFVTANLGVGLFLPIAWDQLKVYQQQRILNFLDPEADRLGSGWQVFQSKIAIGSGGLTGKGYLQGTQKALEFLPAKHTDFVFSVLGEELGFVGALLVLILFGVLIGRALMIAAKVKSQFASTVCVGIAAYFFSQVFVNVAMTIGVAPVTGIPVPFMSYGGSSMVVSCFFVGFLLNCSVRWYEY